VPVDTDIDPVPPMPPPVPFARAPAGLTPPPRAGLLR